MRVSSRRASERPGDTPVSRATVVSIAARDEGRARAMASKHGVPRTHASYEALVADPEIDAVYVPLPNSLHGEWAIRAMEAGKDVYCEKPLTHTVFEARTLANLAKEKKLITQMGIQISSDFSERLAVEGGDARDLRDLLQMDLVDDARSRRKNLDARERRAVRPPGRHPAKGGVESLSGEVPQPEARRLVDRGDDPLLQSIYCLEHPAHRFPIEHFLHVKVAVQVELISFFGVHGRPA